MMTALFKKDFKIKCFPKLKQKQKQQKPLLLGLPALLQPEIYMVGLF